MKITYPYAVEFEVTGDYALFSDPVMRVGGEKTSYQIPTYEALKGIISSVYWKPTITWFIDEVRVMNPIQMETKGVRRLRYNKDPDLSYNTYLKKCRYQVRAHFEWNKNRPDLREDRKGEKHLDIARRMIRIGGRRDVFLGTRECQAYVTPCVFGEGVGAYDDIAELSFGLMYHGVTYADEACDEKTRGKLTVNMWRPSMKNGVIEYLRPEQCPLHNCVRQDEIKHFSFTAKNIKPVEEEM